MAASAIEISILLFVILVEDCIGNTFLRPIQGRNGGINQVAVVHGIDVIEASRWPWQVFIELNNGEDQCGGTLISHQWILTAGHCFDGNKTPTNIVMGSKSKSGQSSNTVYGKADVICCHPDYNTRTLGNDICLLKLESPQAPTATLRPIILPGANSNPEDGKSCYITGWGYDENRNLPDILQEAVVNIIGRDKCVEWHSKNGVTVLNNTICAGHEGGGADSCGGDSGGPLMCADERGQYLLQGITSYGPTFCGAAKAPGVYTKVSDFLEWIEETMENSCKKTHWSSWSGSCSVTCGFGIITKTRVCLDDSEKEIDSKLCKGSAEIQNFCELDPCPTYTWSEWKEGACSQTCGVGVRTDTRHCMDGDEEVSVEKCSGPASREMECKLQNCPEYRFGDWRDSPCSVTCGGGQITSERDCLDSSGNVVEPSFCEGSSFKASVCTLSDCPEYTWGEWGEWSECLPFGFSGSCLGQQHATRQCRHRGIMVVWSSLCGSESQRTQSCITSTCGGGSNNVNPFRALPWSLNGS